MPEPVLAADHVGVRFGAVEAVRDVSLTIAAGEIVGLVGESGSGKTTLCRALLGLQPATSGEVRLDGRPLADWPRRTLPRRVQMLLQDAVSSLSPRMRLRTLLDEPSRIHRLPRRASAAAMDRVLRQLGLPDDLLDKYPHQISGGQARRVVIARALALDPGLLVADEPTAGLDVSVQGEVLNLLLDLHRSRGLAMLIVSHNLNVVRRVTSRVAVMYLGEIVEQAPTAAMFDRPAHPYTAALLSTNPELEPGRRRTPVLLRGDIPSPANPPSGCRFHTRCPVAQPVCRQSEPRFAEVEAGRWVRCHFPYAVAGEPIALAGPVTPGAGHREC